MNRKAFALAAVSAMSFMGASTTVYADPHWNNQSMVSVTCQSYLTLSAGSPYPDCGSGPDGSVGAAIVPKSTKKNTCFFLTDVTATNNNPINGGGRQLDIRNTNSRANPAKVVFFLPYNPTGTNGNGGSTTVQDFNTPIVFTDDLFVDVHTPNNNVFVTVSGYYDYCPKQ